MEGSTKHTEIELKYSATNISLSDFEKYCRSHGPHQFVLASGYDHFYSKKDDLDSFCRHRVGPDSNQLTFKKKTDPANNVIRVEHNINLASAVTVDQISALCSAIGYEYNTTIFKTCFVYKYDRYTLVYYICSDLEHKELGRFMEIEMSEDYPWRNQGEAFGNLLGLEMECKRFGAVPEARITKSLFEMFRKENRGTLS